MKHFIKFLLVIGLNATPHPAYSESIIDTYNTGDTLTATHLNNAKTAVNDNDARIDALEAADLENRITALEASIAAHIADIANPHTVTKSQIGLSNLENIRVNFSATTAPTILNDINDGYTVGSVWIDTLLRQAYVLVNSSVGQADWQQVTNTYSIGQKGPAGGIVFYVTDGGLHGLEAAPTDTVPATAEWGCEGMLITGADGTLVGTGAQNTADILAGCGSGGIASGLADSYSLNGFIDWFLPSSVELQLMRLSLGVGGPRGLTTGNYWSSSELSNITALHRTPTTASGASLKSTLNRVRAVRAF